MGNLFKPGCDPRDLSLTPAQAALLDSTAPRVFLRAGLLTGLSVAAMLCALRVALDGGKAAILVESWRLVDAWRTKFARRGWSVDTGPGGGQLNVWARKDHRTLPKQWADHDLVVLTFMPTEEQWRQAESMLSPTGRLVVVTPPVNGPVGPLKSRVRAGVVLDLHHPLTVAATRRADGTSIIKPELGPAETFVASAMNERKAKQLYGADWS